MNHLMTLIVTTFLAAAGAGGDKPGGAAVVQALTPLLVVDTIEPSVPFWTERLGFETAAAVPEGGPDATGPLGFVMFTNGALNVMYQTRRGIQADAPGVLGDGPAGVQVLYLVIADLDDVMKRMNGAEVLVPERKTFYGMREFCVREPGGHAVIFAQPVAE